ncbi:MAG: DUF4388 domain-containing protein [Deltaproteobacteria bacterium]|nr:DUF4388 domain-containing protein [Deltaproteobacteria bacterium]
MSTDPGDIRILLAAASPRVQVAAKKVLIEEGYRVTSAVDGSKAVELVDQDPPEIVVTVLDLAHVRGPEVAAHARGARHGEPVPCLYLVQATDERSFELTAWDLVLHLPFAATELLERVAALVEARERQAPPVQEVSVAAPEVAWKYDLDHLSEREEPPPPAGPAPVDFDLDGPSDFDLDAPDEPPEAPVPLPGAPIPPAPTPARAADPDAIRSPTEVLLSRLPEGYRQGSLAEHGLGGLLMTAAAAGFTGSLRLEAGRLEKTIHLRHGRPVFCTSNLLSETLGEYLFRQRVITSGALARSVEQMISDGIQQGEALVAQGAVTRDQLAVALSAHVRRKVVNAFAWNEGRFEFRALTSALRSVLTVEMQPLWLIADAVRLFTAPQEFLHFLDAHQEDYALPGPHFDRHTGALATIPGGRALLAAITGQRTVAELRLASGLDELMIAQLLLALTRGELLTFSSTPAAEVAPSPRASDAVIGEMEAAVFADWGTLVEGGIAPVIGEEQARLRDEVLELYTSLPAVDPFYILQVEPSADAAELARAYEAGLSRFAPERFADFPSEEVRRMAGELYRRITTAYEAVRSEEGMARAREARKQELEKLARRSGVLHADLRYRWGRELLEEGKPDPALKQFVEAGRRNTDEPIYLLYAGWAGYLSGQERSDAAMIRQGRQRIVKALEMMPVLVEGYLFLAQIDHDEGQRDEALEHLQRALTLDPNNKEGRRLREELLREGG